MASIVVFCKTLVKGGAEKQALTLAKLLSLKGLDVVVISWSSKKVDPLNHDFLNRHSLKYYGLRGSLLMKFIKFSQILKKEGTAVVLSYLTLANFVAGISRVFNKEIITLGGIRTEKFPVYKFIFERFVHNHLNDTTIFNNYSARKKFEGRGFNPAKINVIHNAINVNQPAPDKNSGNDITLITVARYVEAKDFQTALLSFKRLVENNRGYRFRYFLVGYGPLEGKIRTLINTLGLKKEVEMIINPPNVGDLLRDADIYLSTSLYEGLSNSLMEAMASGLPVVATDVGDNRFLVKDGYNGYLVSPGNVEDIAFKMSALVTSEDLRIAFGINSYEMITENFNEKKLLTKYFELINRFTTKLPTC